MKKLFLFLTLILTLLQWLSAQEDQIAGKLMYLEFGGPGVISSINFDSRFRSNQRLGLGFRLGVGFGIGDVKTVWVDKQWNYTYTEYIKRTYYSIPAGLNYVLGKPNDVNTFEVGAGVAFLTHKVTLYCHDEKKPGQAIGFLTFMYRKIPVNGGFTFRAGFTPIIGTGGDLFPMGAVGIGYAF